MESTLPPEDAVHPLVKDEATVAIIEDPILTTAVPVRQKSQTSANLRARVSKSKTGGPGPTQSNGSKSHARRRSVPDQDSVSSFPRLAFVTVLDPAQLKDRANRKIEHVHSKKEYFRRKRLQEREDTIFLPSKAKEEVTSVGAREKSETPPAPTPHSPSERCSELNAPFCRQCSDTLAVNVDEGTSSRSTSTRSSPASDDANLRDGQTPFSSLCISQNRISLPTGAIDPFESFPVQSNQEISLLMDSFVSNFSHGSVLMVNGPKLPSNFGVIFQLALTDWSLFNSLLFLGTGEIRYHAEAIRLLNEKLKEPKTATDNASMIAILIWSDLSISGGNNRQKHDYQMRGLRKLLQMRNESPDVQESLSERGLMERGILWADLAGAALIQAPRFFAHDAFSTIKLALPPAKHSVEVPHGFEVNAAVLGSELLQVVQYICGFRAELESKSRAGLTFEEQSILDDRKASIEWRLTALQDREVKNPLRECCRLVLHICSSAIFPAYFGPSLFPGRLSHRLAEIISRSALETHQSQHIDLLLWILMISGSRAKQPSDVQTHINALRLILGQFGALCETWEQTVLILETFIWSDKVFGEGSRALWATATPSFRISELR